ncbi:MAG TPA: arginine--tRNA ligase, partial [Candidatus Paceibacterota bacterium]|nr:arginine--tRNA ligase [Candidatus Paceibacterota bacterium]
MFLSSLRELIEEKSGVSGFSLEEPEVKVRGHLATNAAFLMSKKSGLPPMKTAELLRERLLRGKEAGLFSRIEIAAPGFLNFWMSEEAAGLTIKEIIKAKSKWGESPKKKQTIIVEYSSPNVAKPMHVGHLRSTIIGDALANIYEALGYKVIRWNYIGDWGTQFGKLTAAYKLWGKKKAVEKNPIDEMLKLYVRFHEEVKSNPALGKMAQEEFAKLEQGDKENKKLWSWFRKESLKEFNRLYKDFGVKFDVTAGEAFYEKDLRPLIERLKSRGITKVSEGALIVPLETHGLAPALIQKSDGATLYLTRDIANLEYRLGKYKLAKILYVVGDEQVHHFNQLFAVAKILGLESVGLKHVKFGMVLGPDGKKLSTREGKVVILYDLINEAVKLAYKTVAAKNSKLPKKEKEKVARAVGIGAIKYNDLSQNRAGDIVFNWDKMLSLTGNSAPYLQYTYVRLKSILSKAKPRKRAVFHVKHLGNEADLALIMKLSQ